jgi:hypothetical protein
MSLSDFTGAFAHSPRTVAAIAAKERCLHREPPNYVFYPEMRAYRELLPLHVDVALAASVPRPRHVCTSPARQGN